MESTPANSHSQEHPRTTVTSVWRPLRRQTFRNLLIANVFSDIGTFMQSVGAAWLMVSLRAGPMYVALTQTASALPFFLLALPAGALGDIVDRRKLILFTETWMAIVAILLAISVIGGFISPWLLLALTFALSAGDAFETPTWRAVLPELVEKDDLEAAAALNGIEFNLARAIGPGLAGLLIASLGIGSPFIVNALSFTGIIFVIARWKRPHRKRSAPAERLVGATVAALRYVRFSSGVRALTFRTGAVMFFASGLLALLPTVAHNVSHSALAFGLLLGCFGVGAIIGAFLLQPACRRWSIEVVVSGGIAILGVVTITAGLLHNLVMLSVLMLFGGSAWIIFLSLVSALVQKLAPDWVRARVLAIYILVFQGGFAAGSALWGVIAQRDGVATSLTWAGVGTVATIGLGLFWRLPDARMDMTPWNHWRVPVVPEGFNLSGESGPVLVTVEYVVEEKHVPNFLRAMQHLRKVRRRDGASRWGIYRDTEHPDIFVETFIVSSWAEHLRQHERFTRADHALEERINGYLLKEPQARHLIYTTP